MSEAYNIDCMEGMAKYPDKYFELAIVDVPYGINEDGSTNHTRSVLATSKHFIKKGWDVAPNKDYFQELARVSKNQIIWGANHFISRNPLDSSCWIIWDKENGENDFADCELAWTSFKTAARKFTYKWHGMLQGNMKNKEQRIHPTQKPVALYRWLLKNYAKAGDKILDTHLGSGSSRIAAHEAGHPFVGFELDADYFKAQEERFAKYMAQEKLFVPETNIVTPESLFD